MLSIAEIKIRPKLKKKMKKNCLHLHLISVVDLVANFLSKFTKLQIPKMLNMKNVIPSLTSCASADAANYPYRSITLTLKKKVYT